MPRVAHYFLVGDAALPSTHPCFILNFLTQPNDLSGDKRPIDLLSDGEVEKVLKAAKDFHEQGA